jgi:two-component system, cell cycle response regulator
MRPPSPIPRWRLTAFVAMGAGVVFHALHGLFDLGGPGLDPVAQDWVYSGVELLATAVCAARVWRRPQDRWAWTLVTLGLLAWTGGDLLWTVWLGNLADPPFPSVADGLYLAWYPALYAAFMLLIRSRRRQIDAAQWLDGVIVGLALSAVGAALIFPAVLAMHHGRLIEDAVNIAYPLGDFTLLVFVASAFSLAGWRPGRLWVILGAGTLVSAVADIVYVYQTARGTYAAGTVLDTMWPASMSLFAVAAWQPVRRRHPPATDATHTIMLPLAAAAAAWALLMVSAFRPLTPLAVGLAGGTLLLAAARAALTYRENILMMRRNARQAVTDGLTGLGNRRRLMDDLELAVADVDHGHASTLVFFDLNGFKRYNDSFGHAAGDSLLVRLGGALSAAIGARGRAYRLGGDEFCVLLDGRVSRSDTVLAAAGSALTERGSAFTVDASVGIAVVPDDARTASAVLQLADQRMYADKGDSRRGGRARTRDVLMQVLSERTPELHEHVGGVGHLVTLVAQEFGLDSEQTDELLRAAELHDIGKLAIPDEILDKPGPLDDSEWQFMHQHPIVGERILNADPALRPVARLVRASHERWDGAGYPDQLSGTAIPLGARIIAACDAYDAMTSDRCYRAACSPADATAELRRMAGSQFDPTVVAVLCRCLDRAAPNGPRERVTALEV